MEYKLEDLEEKYELELDRIVSEIQKMKAKTVLLQLPDGLKPYALVLADYIEAQCNGGKVKGCNGVSVRVWLGDCFGACDLPDSSCDLVVQFGHSEW